MSCPRCNSEVVTKDGTTQNSVDSASAVLRSERFTRRSSSALSGRGFPDDIIALAVRWYSRYRLGYAEVNEWLTERGVLVDQRTIYRWVPRSPIRALRTRNWSVPTARRSAKRCWTCPVDNR